MDISAYQRFLEQRQLFERRSKENKPHSKKWVSIAKDDLQISRMLYDSGHYASSIYHLQQCYEKLAKGFYLLTGAETPDKVRGHEFTLEKLKKEIREGYIKDTAGLMKSAVNDYGSMLSDKNKADIVTAINVTNADLLDFTNKTEDEIRTIDENTIDKILGLLITIKTNLTNKYAINSMEKKLKQKRTLKIIKFIVYTFKRFRISYSQLSRLISEYDVEKYIQFSIVSINLHILELITFLHSSTPRYPWDKFENEKNETTYFTYNEKLGIVQRFKKMADEADLIIAFFEKAFKE